MRTLSPRPPSDGLAVILWVTLGAAGVHRLYLGYWKLALAQAVGFAVLGALAFVADPVFAVPLVAWWAIEGLILPITLDDRRERGVRRNR